MAPPVLVLTGRTSHMDPEDDTPTGKVAPLHADNDTGCVAGPRRQWRTTWLAVTVVASTTERRDWRKVKLAVVMERSDVHDTSGADGDEGGAGRAWQGVAGSARAARLSEGLVAMLGHQ